MRYDRSDPYQELIGSNEAEDPFHFCTEFDSTNRVNPQVRKLRVILSPTTTAWKMGSQSIVFGLILKARSRLLADPVLKPILTYSPRNQANPKYLRVLEAAGVRSYRDTEAAAVKEADQLSRSTRGSHRRLGRFSGFLLRFIRDIKHMSGSQGAG